MAADPWSEPLDVSAEAVPKCWQQLEVQGGQEDCLVLNVHTTADLDRVGQEELMPVMVGGKRVGGIVQLDR